MTNAPKFAGYVAFDTQKTAIYGFGSSVDEAWASVMQNTDRPVDFDGEEVSDEKWAEGFQFSGASQALLAAINEHGGDIAWQSVNGVACTDAEFEAFNA